ncbi:MAG: hypothetical protein HC778_00345 [Chamaesiphon sp. CSU_1_12]|nr:hypothetical protein [Chamaesiphon sp. CSU_1_12]
MPTNNPKISAYVSQELFDRFEQFYRQRGLSMSQGVSVVLSEYFELESTAPGGLLLERLERVESFGGAIDELRVRLLAIESQLSSLPSKLPPNKESTSSLLSKSLEIKLDWKAIVKRLGVSQSTIERKKAVFPVWSQGKDPDGISWQMVKEGHKLMFIPTDLTDELKSKLSASSRE